MCAECDNEVEKMRSQLDVLFQAEREAQQVYAGDTPAQHAVRLACAIVDSFHDTGHDIASLALGYALTINKLLAVQQIYGIPTV